jgi:hypothetical protein
MKRRPTRPLLIAMLAIGIALFALYIGRCGNSANRATDASSHKVSGSRAPRPDKPSDPIDLVRHAVSREEVVWVDGDRHVRVRRALSMKATPSMAETGDEITAEIAVTIAEGAEYWDDGQKAWRLMDDSRFERWMRDKHPEHNPLKTAVSASIRKRIDGFSQSPSIESVSALGVPGDSQKRDWSVSENGIAIRLNWQDDRLVVWWRSLVIGVEENETVMAIPFPERFKSPPGEQGK